MRRNARLYNLRRFLSVGLAVVMIASTEPIMAYAEDNQETTNEEKIEATGKAEENTETASTAVKDASTALTNSSSGAEKSEQKKVEDLVTSLDNVAGILAEDTIGEDGEVISVKTNLDTAASSMSEGVKKQAEGDGIADSANKKLDSYNEEAVKIAVNNESDTIVSETNTVSKKVYDANHTDSKDDAYKAKAEAESAYTNADKSFKVANDAYVEAEKTVKSISDDYDKAAEAYGKASEEVKAAGIALEAANGRMNEAVKALGDAQADLDFLLANEKGLKEMYEQYHGLMVIYYNDTLGNNVIYNSEGTVDFDACAGEVTEKALNVEAKSPKNDNLYYAGRSLLVEEVTYMLRNEGITDFEFISKNLYTDENGKAKNNYTQKDKAALKELGFDTGKISTKDLSKGGPSLYQSSGYTTTDENNKNGRANCFFVKYTNNDGKTEYKGYNYVIKSSYDVDEKAGESVSSELESGAIFIAEVGSDRNPKAVDSDYMYDDYSELEKKITSESYKKYQAALEAVNNAEQQVKDLKDEIDKLSNCKLDTAVFDEYTRLQSKLTDAQSALSEAKGNKDDLEEKVKAAEDLLKTIDLSRFNTSSSSSSSSSNPSTGTPATTPVVTTVAQAPVQPANELIVTGPIVTLFDDAVPLTDIPVRNTVKNTNNAKAANKTTDAKDATPKKKAAPKKATVEIAEDEVPLAAAPAENIEEKTENKTVVNNVLPDANDADTAIAWWWWLILVVVAAIITKVSYEINKKSKENKAKK